MRPRVKRVTSMESVRLCLDEHLARQLETGASPSPIEIPANSLLEKVSKKKEELTHEGAEGLCSKIDATIQVFRHFVFVIFV